MSATTPEARKALRQAAEWRLLGLLFERPRPGWNEELERLADEVGEEDLQVAARAAKRVDEGSYLAALGPGGAVSPREVGYRPMADPGQLLRGLAVLYESFAYQPRTEDPADHVAVEAGFVAYLALKEAYARLGGDAEAVGDIRRGRDLFLEDHLAVFAGPLWERLKERFAGRPPVHLDTAARCLARRCAPHVRTEAEAPEVEKSRLPVLGLDDGAPFGCEV